MQEQVKNTKNPEMRRAKNTLQSIDKAPSNVTNEIADNSSESEYIPSDNELNSGNTNIRYV